jgi:Circularly permutated YpsA SLOG family
MLKKIISGGLTVADQAVLDAAISLGIPYGGYIPWGRITEIGQLPLKYKLQELNTEDHLICINRNVKESTGTLLISAGELNEGSKYARKESIKNSNQVFVIDLEVTPSFEATTMVHDWILTYNIDIPYIIGPFTFDYHNIDRHMTIIVEGALLLDKMDAPQGSKVMDYSKDIYTEKLSVLPKTVDEAVDQIISDMTLEERVRMANFDKEELRVINYSLSVFIKNQLFMKDLNKELFESCLAVSENKNLNESTAALVIIEKLWEKLRKTYKLRVVK